MTTFTTDTSQPATSARTIELAVTGMTCAACAARVQKQLGKLDGVTGASQLRHREGHRRRSPAPVPVADLIAQVEKAGYGATLITPDARPSTPTTAGCGTCGGGWSSALLLGVPLADLSITLVLVPSLRFPGWQWVLLAMTLPVVDLVRVAVPPQGAASPPGTAPARWTPWSRSASSPRRSGRCTRSSHDQPDARYRTAAGVCCSSPAGRSTSTSPPA